MKRSTRTQRSKHAQAQRNACAGRLLASSGPTTLSIVLTVKFNERVQGIGLVIGRVNAQLRVDPFLCYPKTVPLLSLTVGLDMKRESLTDNCQTSRKREWTNDDDTFLSQKKGQYQRPSQETGT